MFFFFSPSIVSFFFGGVVFCLLQIMKNHTLSLSLSYSPYAIPSLHNVSRYIWIMYKFLPIDMDIYVHFYINLKTGFYLKKKKY